jgi:hypothetical protein
LSEWTAFSPCSDTCNGTQSRFRTYTGNNCPNKRTDEDTRTCASNCTVVCYETSFNGSVITHQVGDLIAETRCDRT